MNEAHRGTTHNQTRPVTLFVTCLADLLRPAVGFASIALLERADCRVHVPLAQTCCGQPAYNSGDYAAARPVARLVIAQLERADCVVVPSGSCAGMIREHYPRLLEGVWRERALALAAKTFELTAFLAEQTAFQGPPRRPDVAGAVAYHDGCAGLRELGLRDQPRKLLGALGYQVLEPDQRDVCCGFGGTFCAKMPEISAKMADDKLAAALATGAPTLTAGDLGCLLHLAGRARRRALPLEFRHVAELLAGDDSAPPIGAEP